MSKYESLTDFAGITDDRAQGLRMLGIEQPEHITHVNVETLARVEGLSKPLANRVYSMAVDEFGEPEENEDDGTVKQLYFCDERPWATDPENFRIMIGPDMKPAATEDDWAVYRTKEAGTNIPEGTELYVFETGGIISFGRQTFQLHLAQLCVDDVEKSQYPGYFIDFPPELTGETLPKVNYVDDESLKVVFMSVTLEDIIEEKYEFADVE